MPLESIEIARKIVDTAADKQASDIVLLDMRQACSFTDYFVIASGESERQLDAIQNAIEEVLKGEAIAIHHREGDASSGWMLIDAADIIVHIFSPFEREFYQLETLWEKAALVVKVL
jgi:ribosome-associated protein